ncbi:MAG: hypothetical protein KDG50_06560 [Chromatiales bacterium]|nr:hypothetical protein [Chromatiales bacterium]
MKPNVTKQVLVALLFVGAIFSQQVVASPITWTTGPHFAGPNGAQAIDNTAVLVEAVNLINLNNADPGVLVVNNAAKNIAFTPRGDIFPATGFNTTNIGSSDANWNAVIGAVDYNPSAATFATLTLTGLMIGSEYRIQLFDFDGRSTELAEVIAFSDGLGNFSASFLKGSATSIFGTFIADATTQNIRLQDDDDQTLNAYVLQLVPSPSVLALMLLGVGLLVRVSPGYQSGG